MTTFAFATVDDTLPPPLSARSARGKAETIAGDDEATARFACKRLDESGDFVERFVARDLTPITIQRIVDATTARIRSDMRDGLASLLNGGTRVAGSRIGNRNEAGAGGDRVFARARDDALFAWRPGEPLDNGGLAKDLIEFASGGDDDDVRVTVVDGGAVPPDADRGDVDGGLFLFRPRIGGRAGLTHGSGT